MLYTYYKDINQNKNTNNTLVSILVSIQGSYVVI